MSWRSTDDVVVALTLDPNAPVITGWRTNGQSIQIPFASLPLPYPLLILHPEEPKLTRTVLASEAQGATIQSTAQLAAALANLRGPRRPEFAGAVAASTTATGVYINHFNIQEGDGWFGNSEMQFISYAIIPPIYQWVGVGNSIPIFEAACERGTYYQNDVVEDQGYYGLFLMTPGVGQPPINVCNGLNGTYAVRIIEKDGGATGEDDEFGWRFYVAGAYPYGGTFGTSSSAVMSFYINTWQTGTRSAYLRIQVN